MDSNNSDRLSRALPGTTSRRQALKLAVGGAMAAAVISPASALAKPQGRADLLTDIPVFDSSSGFEGYLTITHLAHDGAGGLFADLTLVGEHPDVGSVSEEFSGRPITLTHGPSAAKGRLASAQPHRKLAASGLGSQAQGQLALAQQESCQILVLDVRPLELNVLGLVIDLSAVHLEIRAERGPGNLLGNLLCALLGLLDNFTLGTVAQVDRLLNRVNTLI